MFRLGKHLFIFYKIIFQIIISFEFITIFITAQSIIWFFAFLFFQIEFGINGNIKNYFDALWWAYCTTTTVGYGDITPVTFWGRIIAICAMVVGTGIFITSLAIFNELFLGHENLNETGLFKGKRKRD